MLRQSFFPTSSAYRRRSRNFVRPINSREDVLRSYFVKRLDLSHRRPSQSQKSCHKQKQNLTIGDEMPSLVTNYSFTIKCGNPKNQIQSSEISKKINTNQIMNQKNKIILLRQNKKKIEHRQISTSTKKHRLLQMENEEWNLKPSSQRINITERIKGKQRKDLDNIIVGWEYYQQNDNFF